MKKSILEVKNLCKEFNDNGVVNHVLEDVNLDIFENEFTIIMGSSGSGKSTLLYGISGMDSNTAGQVSYEGKDLCKMNENQLVALRRKDFGFVFQQIHLVSNLTLLENVAVPGYLIKSTKPIQVKQRAKELLKTMNLESQILRLPSKVSGGEQQRAAIARAMINKPKILFADEPTGALNRKNSTDVLEEMTKLHRNGQTIVMVTHDLRASLRADRILYLSDGNIIGELSLPPYDEKEVKDREEKVNAWLTSMEW